MVLVVAALAEEAKVVLESAGQVTGTWTPVVPQTKPLTVPANGTQFYRVKE